MKVTIQTKAERLQEVKKLQPPLSVLYYEDVDLWMKKISERIKEEIQRERHLKRIAVKDTTISAEKFLNSKLVNPSKSNLHLIQIIYE